MSIQQVETYQPLVSIIVITYNSSEYVIQTLESVKVQSFQNIELIISDDGSKDNTIEMCEKWIGENKKRFTRSELISVSKNSGIAPNCNRGLYSAKGEWVKYIAGDDMLLPECVEMNASYVADHKNSKIIFSDVYLVDYMNKHLGVKKIAANFFNTAAKHQHKKLLISNQVPAPSAFIKKKLLLEHHGFDERIRFIEDYPLWLKLTAKNIELKYLAKPTVQYRVHDSSVSKNIFDTRFNVDLLKTFRYYKIRYINLCNALYLWNEFLQIVSRIYYHSDLLLIFSPNHYARYARKIIRKYSRHQ